MSIRDEALEMHRKARGKLAVAPKVPLKEMHDLSLAYTPGVAEPCKEIKANKELAYEYTSKWNLVAIATDGTRVLGLGDIGPEAGMPVMEGKALLFKGFGGVDAFPICIDTKDPDKFIETVRMLQPTFGGINLEDISIPKCYDIEDKLKEIMDIPVFHDDQHGTAMVAVAGVLGALRLVKKDIKTVKVVLNGAGAAGTAIAKLLLNFGVTDLTIVKSDGILTPQSPRLDRVQTDLAKKTNPRAIKGGLVEAAKGADVLIGASTANVFTQDIIRSMAQDAVVFGLSNPVPEISYDDAKAAGARVVGTGRSDAPNQINNVLVFPGVFRGALDVRAKQITEEMKVAATKAVADLIPEGELREDYIIPDAFDGRVAPAVAAAVAKVAMDTGVARIHLDPERVAEHTRNLVKEFREMYSK